MTSFRRVYFLLSRLVSCAALVKTELPPYWPRTNRPLNTLMALWRLYSLYATTQHFTVHTLQALQQWGNQFSHVNVHLLWFSVLLRHVQCGGLCRQSDTYSRRLGGSRKQPQRNLIYSGWIQECIIFVFFQHLQKAARPVCFLVFWQTWCFNLDVIAS